MRPSLLAAALCVFSLAARADTFTLTDGPTTISFSLPAMPSGVVEGPFADGFGINNVSILINGASEAADLYFFVERSDGALVISHPGTIFQAFLDQDGPQLFSGSNSSPEFLTGTFALQNDGFGDVDYRGDFDLQISASSSVTPEPSSFALLGTGVLGVAGVVRRRFA